MQETKDQLLEMLHREYYIGEGSTIRYDGHSILIETNDDNAKLRFFFSPQVLEAIKDYAIAQERLSRHLEELA